MGYMDGDTINYSAQSPMAAGGVVQHTEYIVDTENADGWKKIALEYERMLAQKREQLDMTVITRRVWAILAKYFAKNGTEPMSDHEFDVLWKKVEKLCLMDVEKRGIKAFAEEPDFNLI